MNSRLHRRLEGLVIVMIVLVLIQTFLEDFAVVAGFGWDFRRMLIYSAFVFDLFFTLEFLIRYYNALTEMRAADYFFKRRGWIDFFASVPLLALSSGPALFAMILGGSGAVGLGGILNVLKVVKAIRIARILRLLRIAKIFKQIKNTESPMAQRHVAKISTLTISTFVFVILLFSSIGTFTGLPSSFDQAQVHYAGAMETLSEASMLDSARLEEYAQVDESLLIVKREGNTLYSRYDNTYYKRVFGPGDYFFGQRGDLQFFFDLREVNILSSRDNLLYFTVVIALTLIFLFVYSPHFALTVTDPIHVMRRGMDEASYNLEVKTDGVYGGDDIYKLARSYNETFLPMKNRAQTSEESGGSDLSLEDVKDILDTI